MTRAVWIAVPLSAAAVVGAMMLAQRGATPVNPQTVPQQAAPQQAPSGTPSSTIESAILRCEFDAVSPDELREMQSPGPAASTADAAARERCIAHEAFDYELEIDSTIIGTTMSGRNTTKGRIPLRWVYGSRPAEGHWEGFGFLTSSTTPIGAPPCPPGPPIPTADGAGVYDFQVAWAELSIVDPAQTELWVDAGPATETPDTLRLPGCLGGGTSPTNFWENLFFISHFGDRSDHGLQIRGWVGLQGGSAAAGLLATAVTPESCSGKCGGTSTFNIYVKPKTP